MSVTDLLLAVGRRLPRRRDHSGYLHRGGPGAGPPRPGRGPADAHDMGERADWMAGLMRIAPAGPTAQTGTTQ